MRGLVQILNTGVFNKLDTKSGSCSSTSSCPKGRGENHANDNANVFPDERQQPPPVLQSPPIPSIGGSDLYPGPCAGVLPNRGPGIGGGMLVGPNDPRFFPAGGTPGLDFLGGDMIPPGARFDPVGPPNVPGFGPQHFVRKPLHHGGGGIHSDLEHFHNPNFQDPYYI